MESQVLTINRYLAEDDLASIDILNQLRCYIKEAKEEEPKLEDYELYDIGFIAQHGLVLIKIYFYTL